MPSEEIKSRLDIVDVIREYVNLRPAGVNFRANCPFHREKTPSFIVSAEKQIWHCFGCGKGGDVLGFVMEMEGLNFVETLRLLAPKAGVELGRVKVDSQLASKRNRLLDIVKLSALFYHKILLESPAGKPALEYLARRGFSEETIKRWQIGYSSDSWDTLLNFLKSRGYTDEEILLAGMSVKRESGDGFYDRFRGRIMFPICDASGNAVAFSARVSPEKEATEVMGKYINSPQTMIYDKSKILFGLDKAKPEIKNLDQTIIVEGQADVITAHQAGFTNVVGASGTALTTEQVKLLKRFSNNLALSFDMDAAGESAVERGTREALSAEMNVRAIELSSGKDPDECIRNNPDEWRAAVAAAKPVMQYHFDKISGKLDLKKVEDKRKMEEKFLTLIAQVANKTEQSYWLKTLSHETGTPENQLSEQLAKKLKTNTSKNFSPAAGQAAASPRTRTREELLSQLLLALAIKYPEHLLYILNNFLPEQLAGEENRALYKNLVVFYNRATDNWTNSADSGETFGEDIPQSNSVTNQIDYKEFKKWLSEAKSEPTLSFADGENDVGTEETTNSQTVLLDELALLAEKDFFDQDSAAAKAEIIKAVAALKNYYLDERLRQIEKQISEAEKTGETEQAQILLEEFKLMTEEKKELGTL
jgi:DNA primase